MGGPCCQVEPKRTKPRSHPGFAARVNPLRLATKNAKEHKAGGGKKPGTGSMGPEMQAPRLPPSLRSLCSLWLTRLLLPMAPGGWMTRPPLPERAARLGGRSGLAGRWSAGRWGSTGREELEAENTAWRASSRLAGGPERGPLRGPSMPSCAKPGTHLSAGEEVRRVDGRPPNQNGPNKTKPSIMAKIFPAWRQVPRSWKSSCRTWGTVWKRTHAPAMAKKGPKTHLRTRRPMDGTLTGALDPDPWGNTGVILGIPIANASLLPIVRVRVLFGSRLRCPLLAPFCP